MLKYVSLSLILASLSVSTCYGMDDRQQKLQARLRQKKIQQQQQKEEAQARKKDLAVDLNQLNEKLVRMTPENIVQMAMVLKLEDIKQLEESQARLLKSLANSTPEIQLNVQKHTDAKLPPEKRSEWQAVIQALPNTDLPGVRSHKEKISKIDPLFQVIGKKDITKEHEKTIYHLLHENGLDWSGMQIIQDNLSRRLNAVLKSITQVRDGVEKEAEFYSGLNPNFSPDQVVALGFLPFKHDLRRQFVLTLEPIIGQEPNAEYTPANDIEKAILRSGYGIGPATLLSCLEEKPWDFKAVLSAYINLSRYGLLDLNQHIEHLHDLEMDNNLDPLVRKKCALFYAPFCESAIDSYVQFSDLLFPYVNIINNVLKIPGFEEVFSCKNMIQEALEAEKKKNQKEEEPPFSRTIVLALQERYKQREVLEKAQKSAKKEKKMTLPLIGQTQQLPVIETELPSAEEPYSSPSIPQISKKEYWEKIAEEDRRTARKQEAKEKKPKKSHPPEKPTKILQERPEQPHQAVTIEIGGGPFKIYQKIMNESFKGSIEKIVVLIEALHGKVDEGRSGSRIKFELPHIIHHQSKAYLDMLTLEHEAEEEEKPENTPVPVIHDGMHAPHKKKSKKLRSYHVGDIKALLIKAGYVEGAVLKQ